MQGSLRPSALERFASLALGRSIGLFLLLVGLCQYESWSSREVLGRWSIAAAAAIAVVAVAALGSAMDSLARVRRMSRFAIGPAADAAPSRGSSPQSSAGNAIPSQAGVAFDLGLLFLGLSYLLAALADPLAGGRLLELDLFGSFHPPSIFLAWAAGVAFALAALIAGWSRLRTRAPRAFLLFASGLLVLLVGEGMTRAVNVFFPTTQGFPTASTEIWMRRFGRVNSLGFRDVEHVAAKPEGTARLLVIGDSFTFGQGVDRPEDRVSDRLARRLPERLTQPVEVLNAGVPYTHTLQHTETVAKLLAYEPDLIVLLYVFNDIDYLRDSVNPSTALGSSGGALARIHPMRLAFLNSFLVQQIYLRFRHVYWQFAPASERPVSAYEEDALVARHIEDLRRFVEVASARGAEVVIVPFNPDFASAEIDSDSRRAFLVRARESGLPVEAFEDVFRGVDYAALIVNSMDHHPSPEANRILAEALLPGVAAALERRQANAAPDAGDPAGSAR